GNVSVTVGDGYARLVFRLEQEVESDVRLANGIVIISFKQPVDVAVDRLGGGASDYIGAARRDPDGMGVRIALSRKVRVNSMAAGERLFVDLLPEPWTGILPGLPQDVVDELARRAREAEKLAKQELLLAKQRDQPAIRVRVGKQPTFTRYIFNLPDNIGVSNDKTADELALVFDAPLKFDLADVYAEPVAAVAAIESSLDSDSVTVRFKLTGKTDVRTFRENNAYVVDISEVEVEKAKDGAPAGAEIADAGDFAEAPPAPDTPASNVEAPPTVPARIASSEAPAVAAQPSIAPPAAAADQKQPAAAPPMAAEDRTSPPVAPPMMAADPEQPSAPPQAPEAVKPGSVAAAAEQAKPSMPAPSGSVVVDLGRQGDSLHLTFPFGVPTPAAIFRRADILWLVFDTKAEIDFAALEGESSQTIRSTTLTHSDDAAVMRIKLERPRLASLSADGPNWVVTIGDAVVEPTRPLMLTRSIIGPTRSSIIIPFEEPRRLLRLPDPDIGDALFVVTALGPARGFLKTQNFVEFHALASIQGVVIQPLADDLNVELAADKIVVGRPTGLSLSGGTYGAPRMAGLAPVVLDPQLWGFDRQAEFDERQASLLRAAAEASENRRTSARLDLARFYLAQGMNAEAKGVLDVALSSGRPTVEDVPALVLRAVANIMLGRSDEALRDLSNPLVGNQHDAPLWRALARAQEGQYAEAREGFKNVAVAMGTLPIELQRKALEAAVRSSIEVRDFAGAANLLNEFEIIGIPRELEPEIFVLTGRLAEGLGRAENALRAYRMAADSWDRRAAAQGRLRLIALRYILGDLKRPEVIAELESLTTTWRGDGTEIEALQLMARLYTEEGRYRDAFHIMRVALTAHPNSEMTRRIHDEAAATFDSLFLAGKVDNLPAIDALSLFYDFRELTPIGRRGDEMIRRLADRLVSVDLLDQAAELLQYQVDHRLQGSARAQVATRLAVIYLMSRKADRALAALRATRTAELSNELRNQRRLIEARALSDMSRYDVAREVIA
ncbi:MAG: tetratricopeptide repeat protein, partial [Xanthobacteraceae bacterium]